MVSLDRGVGTAIGFLRCQLLQAGAFVLGAVGDFSPTARPAAIDTINASRRLLGCPPADDATPPEPPFTGGQCETRYDVFGTYVSNQTNIGGCGTTRNWQVLGLPGPVSGIRVSGPVQGGWQVGGNGFNFNCADSLNSLQLLDVPTCGDSVGPGTVRSNRPTITSVSRQDGLTDDCGSLPGVYPPPTTFETNTNVTYNIDDGTEVTVNVPFVFAPITTFFDGTLRIPVSFNLGGVDFTGNIKVAPNFDFSINLPSVGPGGGGELPGIEPGPPEEEVPPADPDSKIIGVIVQSAVAPGANITSIFGDDAPDTYAPRLGSIKFAYVISKRTFWSSDIDVKTLNTFIPCPFSQGADRVEVTPVPGAALNFVPITGYPLATVFDVVNGPQT